MAKAIKNLTICKIIFISFLIRIFLVLISGYHPDLGNHTDWGVRFWLYGPQNFYESSIWSVSWPNQPFGTIYLFALIKIIKDLIFNFSLYLNNTFPIFPSKLIFILETSLHVWLVKLPFILSDLGIGYLIYKITKLLNPSKARLAASLFLFNPATIYNSAVWGQTDSLINYLSLLGIYFFLAQKTTRGVFFFLSSFIFKVSLIFYLPIAFITLLKQKIKLKTFIASFLVFLIFITILVLPFNSKNPFGWLWYMYTSLVLNHQGHMLNGNAFNLWFLFFGANLSLSEFIKFGPFTLQSISIFLFSLFSLPILLAFARKKNTSTSLFTTLFLIALTAFLFLTNMHERYLYPIFPIISILVFLKPQVINLKEYFLLTSVHFLNLYNLWFYPDFPILKTTLINNNFLVGKLLTLFLFFFYFKYLVKYLRSDS